MLNQCGAMLSGGEMLRICAWLLFRSAHTCCGHPVRPLIFRPPSGACVLLLLLLLVAPFVVAPLDEKFLGRRQVKKKIHGTISATVKW
uniref:Uncharacterized protein n=1 Tax=Anopheles farauti TaxID=69004 RepID=A0A182QRN3_9DIPT